jgi:hypothetical protein
MGIVVVTMGFSPAPESYHTIFIVPSIALESAMACLVFRGIKLGTIADVGGSTKTAIQFKNRSHVSPSGLSSNTTPNMRGTKNSRHGTIAIDVMRMSESDSQSEGKKGHLQGSQDGHTWEEDRSEIIFDPV